MNKRKILNNFERSDTDLENVFNYPEIYINSIIKQSNLMKCDKEKYTGKSLVLVMFTSACDVGCPFCCFKALSSSCQRDIKNQFNEDGVDKFIDFANLANTGYLQISGGGEPFLEKEAILKSVERINADRIVLVTGGLWAYNKEKAEKYLSEIEQAIKKRKTKSRITIRLSVSKDHSIKLKHYPLENLINLFESKYKDNNNFTLQIKTFDKDPTLENNLKIMGRKYKIEKYEKNKSDDEILMKIMPWRSKIVFDSGYEIIMGISRLFYPSFRPNLNDKDSFDKMVKVYDVDLNKSQNNFPALVYNSTGGFGLDWIVEYNGNISTWQNSIQDDRLNVYEDNYEKALDHTLKNLITRSFIDKGAKYREHIVSEISPKTVMLMKAIGIRDYASVILFADDKIRLYSYIRILQDYITEGKINEYSLLNLPISLKEMLLLPKKAIKKYYMRAENSILSQELRVEQDPANFKDFLELVKLGHYEMSEQDVQTAISHYNMLFPNEQIRNLDDFFNDNNNIIFRLRDRMSPMKKINEFNIKNNDKKTIYIFRHGETNWNVENRIRGQYEDSSLKFTDKGIKQIDNISLLLKKHNIEFIYSSDLIRTKNTVALANKNLKIPMSFHKELRAWNVGKFQGLPLSVFLKDQEGKDAILDYNKVVTDGESINQLRERIMLFLENYVVKSSYNIVAIITHGATMSNLKSVIDGEEYIDIDYCKIVYSNKKFKVIETKVSETDFKK